MNPKRFFLYIITLLSLSIMVTPLAAQSTPLTDKDSGVSYTVSKYLPANYPVALAFAPDGRLFYTEKTTGNVRVVSPDGKQQIQPVIHLDTDAIQERGLIGIALDPAYATNGMIWVFHTKPGTASGFATNEVVRFHEKDGLGSDPDVMLSIPITNNSLMHFSGNLGFDKNGWLYLTLGDYGDPANSQDLKTMPGKIHRFQVTDDGLKPAPGNPYPDSSIYAYGLRNSFDFAFDPVNGSVFATENGLNCDDELNLILPGFNYGARANYECVGMGQVDLPLYMSPLLSWTPTIAPTGVTFYDNPAVPAWKDQLFYCSWNEGVLTRVELDDSRAAVKAQHPMDLGGVQCRIAVEVGIDGGIYFTEVGADGGAIWRLMPTS